MDLSKLPRLSGNRQPSAEQTSAPAGGPVPPPAPTAGEPASGPQQAIPYDRAPAGGSMAAEIWIQLIGALIFLWFGREFAKWALLAAAGRSMDTGVTWTVAPKAGQMVGYWELPGHQALTESGAFLFGMVALLEVAALIIAAFSPKWWRPITWAVIFVALVTVLYNAAIAAVFFSEGGFAIVSLAIVAFGGYTVITQWQGLRRGSAGV